MAPRPVSFFPERRVAMGEVEEIVGFLLANPVLLAPLLLVAAAFLFAVLKKLLKLASILAIAGGLYLLLLRFFG